MSVGSVSLSAWRRWHYFRIIIYKYSITLGEIITSIWVLVLDKYITCDFEKRNRILEVLLITDANLWRALDTGLPTPTIFTAIKKIADIWKWWKKSGLSASQYSFPGIDIFHVIYTRGTEVSKSYSTTTPSLLCTENSTSRFKLFHKNVIFKMALSHWHLSLPLFFTSDLPASNKLSSHRALQIKKRVCFRNWNSFPLNTVPWMTATLDTCPRPPLLALHWMYSWRHNKRQNTSVINTAWYSIINYKQTGYLHFGSELRPIICELLWMEESWCLTLAPAPSIYPYS